MAENNYEQRMQIFKASVPADQLPNLDIIQEEVEETIAQAGDEVSDLDLLAIRIFDLIVGESGWYFDSVQSRYEQVSDDPTDEEKGLTAEEELDLIARGTLEVDESKDSNSDL